MRWCLVIGIAAGIGRVEAAERLIPENWVTLEVGTDWATVVGMFPSARIGSFGLDDGRDMTPSKDKPRGMLEYRLPEADGAALLLFENGRLMGKLLFYSLKAAEFEKVFTQEAVAIWGEGFRRGKDEKVGSRTMTWEKDGLQIELSGGGPKGMESMALRIIGKKKLEAIQKQVAEQTGEDAR